MQGITKENVRVFDFFGISEPFCKKFIQRKDILPIQVCNILQSGVT
ncbi:hypothetical protein DYY67_0296 [Candidatus Nitrosotalea sp. TS]|nr:hypothetical protein [Candidatus Nitrosotalea sp. TS]